MMNQARFKRLDALFNAALDRPEEERGTYLDEACGGDEELRNEVERMLAAQADETFLARPLVRSAGEVIPAEVRVDEALGQVGRIRIVEHLGSGGMGKVYRGVDETLRRPVAVKVLRHRLPKGSPRRARLLREAQVVSQLAHPGICQVYDFIEGEEFDYLVLELIEGETLKEVMAVELSLAEALQIAQQIAEALAAAHSRGVVHRDLKPSNVMLAAEGSSGRWRVKVLDFGIARIAEAEPPSGDDFLPVSTSREASTGPPTLTGLALGTPRYMSPEQAAGAPATSASDMFAFGLLLQEMVTGHPAFDRDLPPDVLMGKVRTAEIEPRKGLPRELDELCARLQSVSPAVRPVAADTAERLRWIERGPRRRARQIAYAGLTLVLLILAVGMSFLAFRLRDEVGRANHEASTAREVSDFLVELFEVSDPWQAEPATVTAREILDRGARKIRYELADRPRTRARLLDTIGDVYRRLRLVDEATPLLEEALKLRRESAGPESMDVATSLSNLGLVHLHKGEYEIASRLLRQSLGIQRRLLGSDRLEIGETLNKLGYVLYLQGVYDEAEQLQREAFEIYQREYGRSSLESTLSLEGLVNIYSIRGEYKRAEELAGRILEIRQERLAPTDPDLANGYSGLAYLYIHQERFAEAEPLLLKSLEIREKAFGPDHSQVAIDLNSLQSLYRALGRFQQAEVYALRSIKIREATLEADHPRIALALHGLAGIYRDLGELERSEELYLRSLEIWRKALGPEHSHVATNLDSLAEVYRMAGDRKRAEPLYLESLAINEKIFDSDHPNVVRTLNSLAQLYLADGDTALAEPLLKRVLEATEGLLSEDPDSPLVRRLRATALLRAGTLYQARGDGANARESWAEAVQVVAPVVSESDAVSSLHVYCLAQLRLRLVEEARPFVDRLLATGWRDPELLELWRRHGLP